MLQLPQMSFTDAYFEAVSCLTTTGSTTLVALDSLPASLHAWARRDRVDRRPSGVVVLAVAILPVLGVGGSQVFMAELPGPMKEARLTPAHRGDREGALPGLRRVVGPMRALPEVGRHDLVRRVLPRRIDRQPRRACRRTTRASRFFDSPAIEFVAMVFMTLGALKLRDSLPGIQAPQPVELLSGRRKRAGRCSS